jgi:four helix bundle protein
MRQGVITVRAYKDLDVWQVSMALAVDCYKTSRSFPKDELYGLTSQVRRAASSIPANIAEGYGRETTKSYVQFLRIAQGSAKELETHIMLAERVDVCRAEEAASLLVVCDRVSKMLRNLIRALQAKANAETDP